MTLRQAFCLLLVSGQLLAQCDVAPPALDLEDPRLTGALEQVVQWLEQKRIRQDIPGISVVVVCGGQTLLSKGLGYADLEEKRPATDRTVYRVGGMTKVFTATMLMQLRDRGRVHLDTPVTELMGSYAVKACPGEGPPTLVELASHRAGLPHAPQTDFWTEGQSLTEIDILKTLPDTRAVVGRQQESHYSHLSYVILGHALSLAAEQPYSRYMWKQVLEPLGMTDSAFEVLPMIQPLLATGYTLDDGGHKVASLRMWEGLDSAYGLMTSARDLGRFFALQFGLQPEVLRPTSVREMQGPRYIFPGWEKASGIGWHLFPENGMTAVGHRGTSPGFKSEMRMLPELQLGVGLLGNLDSGQRWMGLMATSGGPTTTGYQVLEILRPVIAEMRAEQLAKLQVKGPAHDLSEYAGSYAPDRGRAFFKSIIVTVEDGKLKVFLKGVIAPLVHIEGDQFRIEGKETITFIRNEHGDVTGLRLNGGGFLFRRLNPA